MFSHFLRKLTSLASRPDPAAVRAGGFVWHPASADVVPHLPTLFTRPHTVVKHNHQRTVLRVELPGGAVFVKRVRANTPRAWVRELLRPPKARLEFENAVRLRELGLACAEPLAWAEPDSVWPGESVIVSREVPAAVPLDEYLSAPLSLTDRRRIAAKLGRLFADLHAAGVAHPDPHPGNFLIQPAWQGLVLLDVHAVRFGPPLTWEQRRANLVLFNRWFQLRSSRTQRARFWRAYTTASRAPSGAGSGQPTAHAVRLAGAKETELLTAASNRRFWAARTARYLGNNRQFRRVKAKGVRGHAVRDLPDEVVRAWLADPDGVFRSPAALVLKDSPSSTVILSRGAAEDVSQGWSERQRAQPLDPNTQPVSPGGATVTGSVAPPGLRDSRPTPGVVLAPLAPPLANVGRRSAAVHGTILWKRFNLKRRTDALKNLVRRSEAVRSWVFGHALLDRHLPTARPLFVAHRSRFGVPHQGYVAFEVVPDAVELPAAVSAASFAERKRLADSLGRLIRTLHDRGCSHRDLKAPNILISRGEPVFIDLVGLAVHQTVPDAVRRRDLARLAAGFLQAPHVSRTVRLRALLAYLHTWPARTDWKGWWRAIAHRTAAKVRKNARSGRPLA